MGRVYRISRVTVYQYGDEFITVLADEVLGLHQSLQEARERGPTSVILDGTVVGTDRMSEKTNSVQGKSIGLALSASTAFPLWVFDAKVDSVRDITTVCEHILPRYTSSTEPPDGGYVAAGIGVHTPSAPPPGSQVLGVDNPTQHAEAAQQRRTRPCAAHATLAHHAAYDR